VDKHICKDIFCIAEEGEYCIRDNAGWPIPDVPDALGAAVISPGTLTTPEETKTAIETNDTITLPANHGFKVGDDITITTEGGSQDVTVTAIIGTTQVKPRTGRRLDRRPLLVGDGKQRILPRVRGCGHKLDLKRQPRHRNCKVCWTAFFRNQDEMAENIAKILVEQGAHRIAETFGDKFLTRFHEYCSLVERMEALRKAFAEDQNAGIEFASVSTQDSVQSVGGDAEVSIEVG